MTKTVTVRGSPILLDQILNAELGPIFARTLLAETLTLNPTLADAGAVLPIGRVVIIPDRPVPLSTAPRPVISLFG